MAGKWGRRGNDSLVVARGEGKVAGGGGMAVQVGRAA